MASAPVTPLPRRKGDTRLGCTPGTAGWNLSRQFKIHSDTGMQAIYTIIHIIHNMIICVYKKCSIALQELLCIHSIQSHVRIKCAGMDGQTSLDKACGRCHASDVFFFWVFFCSEAGICMVEALWKLTWRAVGSKQFRRRKGSTLRSPRRSHAEAHSNRILRRS